MSDRPATHTTLIELANSAEVTRTRQYSETASSLDADRLLDSYVELRDTAPDRHARGKKYFVGHTGIPSTTGTSSRVEEHLAIALCADSPTIQPQDFESLRLLDYQVPLKAKRSDAGIGKVDIMAVTSSGRIAVVELKVTTPTSKGNTPLRALLEALAYCAIVEANTTALSSEILGQFGLRTAGGRPDLVVMGPNDYWSRWNDEAVAAVHAMSDRIASAFSMRIWFLDLGDVGVRIGVDGSAPRLIGEVGARVLHDSTP